MRRSFVNHGRNRDATASVLCVRRQAVVDGQIGIIDIVVVCAKEPEGGNTKHAANARKTDEPTFTQIPPWTYVHVHGHPRFPIIVRLRHLNRPG